MNISVLVAALVVGTTAFAFALLFQKLISPARGHMVNAEWLSRFSVAKYRPMERLLAEADYRYLETRKGYTPGLRRRLRKERVKVFRGYLRCLKADFGRLEAAVNLWMANSPTDRPDLAKELLKQRLVFTLAMLSAEWNLVLYGIGAGGVDVHRLVGSLDGMRVHLSGLALARQASAA